MYNFALKYKKRFFMRREPLEQKVVFFKLYLKLPLQNGLFSFRFTGRKEPGFHCTSEIVFLLLFQASYFGRSRSKKDKKAAYLLHLGRRHIRALNLFKAIGFQSVF